jgi:hypothetical protein
MVPWSDFELVAPELAASARRQFAQTRVALLGTIRADGSPRIDPIELSFGAGHLLFGAMRWTHKAADLLRDDRCVVHSVITDSDGGGPEAKITGRALVVDDVLRAACPDAWWAGDVAASAMVFAVQITLITVIEWDLDRAQLTATTWSPDSGVRVRRRSYP